MRVLFMSQISIQTMAPITAARVEALLQPQYWKNANSWNDECSQLIDDLHALECDPRHTVSSLPDLAQWTGAVRPDWTADGMADRVVLPEGMEFINPIFAWLGISLWPQTTGDNVSGLFRVLMRCGCDSVKALGAVTSTGRVVLQFAAAASYAARKQPATVLAAKERALHLLMAQPNLPLFSATAVPTDPDRAVDGDSGPFCCALCTAMHYQLDSTAVEVLLRLTPAQRLAAVSAPHWAFALAINYSCQRTFEALWCVVRDRVIQPDCDAAEVDRIVGGPVWDDDYRWSAFTGAAINAGAHGWWLVTNAHCPLAYALLRHANAHPERQYTSPLSVLPADEQTHSESDLRGAWLVPRLHADVLNAYDEYGCTAVMQAAEYALPKTLAALLDRGVEVDLTAERIECKTVFDPDALVRANTTFAVRTAADLLPDDDDMTAQFMPIAARLRAETKAQMALRPLIAAAVVPALQQFGGTQMPRELLSLCLAYANLPEPLHSVCTGAKRIAGGSTDGEAKPSNKRLRLT